MKSIVFGILGVALVAGPFLFGSPVRDVREALRSGNWEAAQGKVIAVSERTIEQERQVDVTFTYEYQGKTHQGAYRMENARRSEIPNKGASITVKVNPRDPTQAFENPGMSLFGRALGLFFFAGFGIYLLFMVLTGRAEDIPVSFSSGDRDRD
jgi:hypothetical protein